MIRGHEKNNSERKYLREILQLFTVGVKEINHGTLVRDG